MPGASALAKRTPRTDPGLASRQVFQGFRARDFPGVTNIPTTNTAAATVTVGTADAASTITSAVTVKPSKEYFRLIGAVEPKWGSAYPDYQGWKFTNYYNSNTSAPPYQIEFDLDTVGGIFELITKSFSKFQILVNGQYVSTTPYTMAATGTQYLVAVNLGAAGRYRIRIEFDGGSLFWGLKIGPTDAVYATPRRGPRAIWMGDSFGEPTISDSAASWHGLGLPVMFGHLTGLEIIHASKGGTGLVQPGAFVKFADRLADILTQNPGVEVFILQLSSNDSSSTTAAWTTQFQSIIASLQAAGFTKYGQIIVLSHWWSRYSQGIPAATIDQAITAKAYCAANGIVYVDTLLPSVPSAVTTTVAASVASGFGQLSAVATIPDPVYAPGGAPNGEVYIQIGNPGSTTLEVRKITSTSGTGPYTIGVTPNLSFAHSAGEQIVQVGPSPITGNGYMGAVSGTGNGDRMAGVDGTHPSIAGGRLRAIAFAHKLASLLPR